jgi:tRNA(fMet)-specific endonuclease VapC
MKYLLDTDVCIYFFKEKHEIIEKIQQTPDEDLAVSIMTIAELEYGAFNSERVKENLERVDCLEKKVHVLTLASKITREYARIKSILRKQGAMIDDFDILIGATALVNNLTLVTNNEQHFSRIDNLTIENWISV